MNERPCVRCGLLPRHDDSFICSKCAASGYVKREVRRAEEAAVGHAAQRQWLIEHGWVGGWGIRRGSVRA